MSVERMYIAAAAGGELSEVQQINLVAGAGIEGDRYFNVQKHAGQNITLVEAEEIEAFNAAFGVSYDLSCTRRNIVTRGTRLNELVGREFRIADVRLRGVELCEPCSTLGASLATADLEAKAVIKHFVHRAGLRADILSSGRIAIGDRVDSTA